MVIKVYNFGFIVLCFAGGYSMFWSVRPVVCIGCGSPFNSLVGDIVNRSSSVYVLNLSNGYGGKVDFDGANVIRKSFMNINGRENFLRSSSIFYFVFPFKFLVDFKGGVYDFVGRILKACNDRRVRIVFGVYFNGCRVDGFDLIDFYRFCCDVSVNPIGFLVFDEVFGPGVDCGVVFDVLRLFSRSPLRVVVPFSAGDVRDYVYVKDFVDVFIDSIDRFEEDCLVLISGFRVSVARIVRCIMVLLGLDGVGEVSYSVVRGSRRRLDKIFGCNIASWFKPKIGFEKGLKETIDWFEVEFGPILVCNGGEV